jgi:hypothetical protein
MMMNGLKPFSAARGGRSAHASEEGRGDLRLIKVLAMVGGDHAGKRDRALMLLGFALAARRSELCRA